MNKDYRVVLIQNQLEQVKKDVSVNKQNTTQNTTDINSTNDKITGLQGRFSSAQAKCSELKTKLGDLRITFDKADDEVARQDISLQISDIEKEIECADCSMKQTSSEIGAQQKTLTQHEKRKQELKQEEQTLQAKQNSLEEEIRIAEKGESRPSLIDEELHLDLDDSQEIPEEQKIVEQFNPAQMPVLPKVTNRSTNEEIVHYIVKGKHFNISQNTELYRSGSGVHLAHFFENGQKLDFDVTIKDFESQEAGITYFTGIGQFSLDISKGKNEITKENEKRIMFGYKKIF